MKNHKPCIDSDGLCIKMGTCRKQISQMRCKDFYVELISDIIKEPTAIAKWESLYGVQDWAEIFKLPFTVTFETDIQSLQYKIIHRFFPCNYTLSIWFRDISRECSSCLPEIESDTLEHYFIHCKQVVPFWKKFEEMWKSVYKIWFPLTDLDILFGIRNSMHIDNIDTLNCCILLSKMYIFKAKNSSVTISFQIFKSLLKEKLELLRYIDTQNARLDTFLDKWGPLLNTV